jgi:septal ring factor EnvC (AmiA/AmiB activator)
VCGSNAKNRLSATINLPSYRLPGYKTVTMSVIEQQITRIGQKLQQLVKRCNELQQENSQLRQQLNTSEQRNRDASIQITELQHNILTLKSSLGQLSEEEKKLFEKRINAYLRDMEKAITLLGE